MLKHHLLGHSPTPGNPPFQERIGPQPASHHRGKIDHFRPVMPPLFSELRAGTGSGWLTLPAPSGEANVLTIPDPHKSYNWRRKNSTKFWSPKRFVWLSQSLKEPIGGSDCGGTVWKTGILRYAAALPVISIFRRKRASQKSVATGGIVAPSPPRRDLPLSAGFSGRESGGG